MGHFKVLRVLVWIIFGLGALVYSGKWERKKKWEEIQYISLVKNSATNKQKEEIIAQFITYKASRNNILRMSTELSVFLKYKSYEEINHPFK